MFDYHTFRNGFVIWEEERRNEPFTGKIRKAAGVPKAPDFSSMRRPLKNLTRRTNAPTKMTMGIYCTPYFSSGEFARRFWEDFDG